MEDLAVRGMQRKITYSPSPVEESIEDIRQTPRKRLNPNA